MRVGFRTSPQNTDWASLEAAWAEAGQHDVFDRAGSTTTSWIRAASVAARRSRP